MSKPVILKAEVVNASLAFKEITLKLEVAYKGEVKTVYVTVNPEDLARYPLLRLTLFGYN